MRALVSGQAGLAVLIDGDDVCSVHVDSPEPIRRSKADIPHILAVLADSNDVLELPETTAKQAAAALDLSWRQDRALHLILILLDREADEEARRMSAECLEEFLADPRISDFVCNRLYSAPLPDSADMVGALLLVGSLRAARLSELLDDLGEVQPEIRRRRTEWDALRPDLFGGLDPKLQFGYVVVTSGLFRRVVQSEPDRINNVLVTSLADPRFRRLRNSRGILMSWIPRVPVFQLELSDVFAVGGLEPALRKLEKALITAVYGLSGSIKQTAQSLSVTRNRVRRVVTAAAPKKLPPTKTATKGSTRITAKKSSAKTAMAREAAKTTAKKSAGKVPVRTKADRKKTRV